MDLIERLRDSAWYTRSDGADSLMKEAADRIAELEAALQIVKDSIYCTDGYRGVGISEEAERAVEQTIAEKDDE